MISFWVWCLVALLVGLVRFLTLMAKDRWGDE
jgi:hypothetical protein